MGMAKGRVGRGADQFPLRLPEGLRDRLKVFAESNGRSMNAEILSRLEEFDNIRAELELVKRNAAKTQKVMGKQLMSLAEEGDRLRAIVHAHQQTSDQQWQKVVDRLESIEGKLENLKQLGT